MVCFEESLIFIRSLLTYIVNVTFGGTINPSTPSQTGGGEQKGKRKRDEDKPEPKKVVTRPISMKAPNTDPLRSKRHQQPRKA